jgi:hypothetical protein
VTGGKPIAVLLQSISGVTAFNPLVAFYDILGGKREVVFFYFVPNTRRLSRTDCVVLTCHAVIRTYNNLLRKLLTHLPQGEEALEQECEEPLAPQES